MLHLGSQSPRRKEILSFFTKNFTIKVPPFDEALIDFEGDPAAYVETLSREKALSIGISDEDVLITADTIVALDDHILEKPTSNEHAIEMLLEMSGRQHSVFSGVTVKVKDRLYTTSQETVVTCHEYNRKNAERYVSHFNVLDKAGGYSIQDGGGLIVESITGCYYNVMGLPLQSLREMLAKGGVNLWDLLD